MKLRPQFRSQLRYLVAAGCLALVPTHALVAQAQGAPLLSISDPEGDDVGDGNLLPPREPVIEPGDLDFTDTAKIKPAEAKAFARRKLAEMAG